MPQNVQTYFKNLIALLDYVLKGKLGNDTSPKWEVVSLASRSLFDFHYLDVLLALAC